MTHGWKTMNHTIILEKKERGVLCCHAAKNNFVITMHWNVGTISDLILPLCAEKANKYTCNSEMFSPLSSILFGWLSVYCLPTSLKYNLQTIH